MKNVLIIAPHADDEVLGVGGTIQKHIKSGDNVTTLILCDRRNMEHQRDQATHASKILGYRDVYWGNLVDETLDNMLKLVIDEIESVYLRVKPNVIYTCYESDINTDHQVVFRASTVACRILQPTSPATILSYEVPSSTTQSRLKYFEPNWYSKLDRAQVDTKVKALNQYSDELRTYPNPRCSEGLTSYAKFRGMECNCEYAEAFKLIYNLT